MNRPTLARDIMVSVARLVTLSPQMDVFEAIRLLLKHQISGAPVVGPQGELVGVFTERNSMSVIVEGAYEQLPTNEVFAFMDTDAVTIHEEMDLLSVAQTFRKTRARRLAVVRDGLLVGQLSRRDLMRAVHEQTAIRSDRGAALLYLSSLVDSNQAPIA